MKPQAFGARARTVRAKVPELDLSPAGTTHPPTNPLLQRPAQKRNGFLLALPVVTSQKSFRFKPCAHCHGSQSLGLMSQGCHLYKGEMLAVLASLNVYELNVTKLDADE